MAKRAVASEHTKQQHNKTPTLYSFLRPAGSIKRYPRTNNNNKQKYKQ